MKDVIEKSQEAGKKYINAASAFFEDKKIARKKARKKNSHNK